MLYLLYGSEDFLKKQYLQDLASESKARLDTVSEIDIVRLSEMLEPSLFSEPKILVLPNILGQLDEETLEKLKDSSQPVVLIEDKLDKRKKETKALLTDKKITAQEFVTPISSELQKWIQSRLKSLGAKITTSGLKALMDILEQGTTTFGGPQWNLWTVDSELQKFAAYAGKDEIDAETIKNLASLNYEPEIWSIINAVAEKNRIGALAAIERFLATAEGSDEKAKIIQLGALLADQARNILLVKSFSEERVSDAQILAKTAWKSGRLFVLKRLAGRFSLASLKDTLTKLEALDAELKSSGLPARVLLDLIVVQMS